MAIINNQAVIQKLIDELKLYPGTDSVPTELAEKILPVYQVNTEEVTISQTVANVVRYVLVSSGSTTTIYTVPATGKFFLTNFNLSMRGGGATGTVSGQMELVPKASSGVIISKLNITVTSATENVTPVTNSMNLQNPLELEPGSLIEVTSTGTNGEVIGNIVGYTID